MKKTLVLLATALLLLAGTAAVIAAGQPPKPKTSRRVIMVIANGITTADLLKSNEAPNITKSLKGRAALGLMNTRAARATGNSSSSYLSIGVGARANAGKFGNLAFGKGETLRFAGTPEELPLRGPGEIVSPSLPEMSRLAAKLSYQALPGTLGELLRRGGIKRSVFGNADTLGVYRREVNLIAMDGEGSTDFGDVRKQIDTPERAMASINQGLKKSRFVVLEYAPTSIIDLRRDFLTDRQVVSERRAKIREIDRLFGNLLKRYGTARTMVILIAPAPPTELVKSGALQTPLVVAGPGYRGLLTSAGTRWPGLVTNTDIAPTILTFFSLPIPPFLPGRPLVSEPNVNPAAVIDGIAGKAIVNYATRSVLLSGYITMVVITIIAAAAALLLWPRAPRITYLQPLLLSLMYMPVVMLINNSVDYPSFELPLVLIPLAALLAGWLTWLFLRRSPLSAIVIPCFLSVVTVLIQLPFGSALERNSVMGMSSIIGARFYGIGNEYTGVLLGSAGICLAFWLALKPRGATESGAAAAVSFAALTIIIGSPALGANIGGALAAVATGVFAFLLVRGVRLAPKHLFFMVVAMAAVAAVILVADYLSSSASHAARAAALVGGGGPGQALIIIARKASINFMLLTRSSWTNIILAAAAAVVALQVGARQIYDLVSKEFLAMQTGFKIIVLGAAAAFFLNDSGIVAAAIMVIYAVGGWLYLMLFSARSLESPRP